MSLLIISVAIVHSNIEKKIKLEKYSTDIPTQSFLLGLQVGSFYLAFDEQPCRISTYTICKEKCGSGSRFFTSVPEISFSVILTLIESVGCVIRCKEGTQLSEFKDRRTRTSQTNTIKIRQHFAKGLFTQQRRRQTDRTGAKERLCYLLKPGNKCGQVMETGK